MEGDLIKNQRVDEGRIEAEHGKLDYEDSSEDEEVKLFSHRKGADEPDPPGADIRDVPEACRRRRTLSETNGCLGRSLSMGLARSGIRERPYMIYYMCFIQTFIIRCTVSEILVEIDHKGLNWTFLTLKMTFRLIPYLSYFRTGLVSQQRSYMMQ